MSSMHAEAVRDLNVASACIHALLCTDHEDENRVPTMVGAALIAEACMRLRSLKDRG